MSQIRKNRGSEAESMNYELQVTREQNRFNEWLYSSMKPYLKGDILETGSGMGTFSEKIIKDFSKKVYLSEINPDFIKLLKKQFKQPRVKVIKLDIGNPKDYKKIKVKFDSIFSSNVLEHVNDDALALKMLRSLLKPRGTLVLLVPCHKFLFCQLDQAEGHYRRYSRQELRDKAKTAGFKIKKEFWFNMSSIPARFISGNLLKHNKTPQGSFSLFNKLVPFIKFVEEKIFRNIAGVSRVAVLER